MKRAWVSSMNAILLQPSCMAAGLGLACSSKRMQLHVRLVGVNKCLAYNPRCSNKQTTRELVRENCS